MSEIIISNSRRRTIELGLALLKRPASPQRSVTSITTTATPHHPARTTPTKGVLDLPRVCAVHDRIYMSRYIDQGRGFVYSGGVLPENSAREQYRDHASNTITLPNSALDTETCPWCGSVGFASVHCGSCNSEVCFGRTAKNYFQCRPSCDGEGPMTRDPRPMQGVRPALPSPRTNYGAKR